MAFGKFGKYYPDDIEFKPETFELLQCIRTALLDVFDGQAAQYRIQIASGSQAIMLHTDINHLRYIVINLVQNALKYSADAAPVVLTVETQAAGVKITVSDSGIGIPDDAVDDLYSPFFRAANVGDRPGTGMGLAIVKKSAKLIDASLELKSDKRGTDFSVILPLPR